jgi:hypothetical protein
MHALPPVRNADPWQAHTSPALQSVSCMQASYVQAQVATATPTALHRPLGPESEQSLSREHVCGAPEF